MSMEKNAGRNTKQQTKRVIAITALVLILDQLTKYAAKTSLQTNAIDLKILTLHYVQNTGTAFSLFSGMPQLVLILSIIITTGLIIWHKKLIEAPKDSIALGLIIGGALGNILDRVIQGFVIDFIDVGFWPVFNIADTAICIGIGLLILREIKSELAKYRQESSKK